MKERNEEEKVLELSNRFDKAQVENDIKTIETFFSPGARIIGPRGFITSADEWINVHKKGEFRQTRLQSEETEIQVHDGTAIIHDLKHSEGDYKGQVMKFDTRVTEVWIKQNESWRLTSIQHTPAAGKP